MADGSEQPVSDGSEQPVSDDETQIRDLIRRWARAVHEGDLDAVLADHADDIVMFDVPPPEEGVRGIAAYRDTWPPFFDWQRQGAVFDIVSLEVAAGGDVAFAHALLRCGTEEELAQDPGNRLRLTLGLRRQDGRWVVPTSTTRSPAGGELSVVPSAPRSRGRTRRSAQPPGRGPERAPRAGGRERHGGG
ncbi:YybH family protein [Blastococcus mobilis]|uniref:SnoaL-like domain-containing protein n=1 Tax=Blastococcus mobilis TaxID=1938746 RepID=A0A238UQN3_9ACTN|nr:nuclear transport factor 2 family protein [Blastococcus mobilis]SNR23629.1 conserved hypothetical protein [Blastococcus mobilis]